ncbi:olfactory receptor 11L1-like [Dendropsophus ebraccatus]|uniref:olfactory receptor 11L1-like n=1 Tax=Dendropsophus ebraccatus TaxID=150705 RepID=UPI0038319349
MTLVRNWTLITEIHLLGFGNLRQLNIGLFLLFFLIYYVTISGNVIIILLVSRSRSLQSPMYFFLTQLSVCDSLMATTIIPNTLYVVMDHDATVTFAGCLAQFYFFSASLALESLLLTGMSYDRYLAICNPLRYNNIMDYLLCIKFIVFSWVLSFSVILNHVLAICHLEFCGPNVIDHYFCDLSPLLELSCSDTFIVQVEVTILVIPMALLQFLLVIVSYSYIIAAILGIPSETGRQKAFSTCSSHLTMVSMYYGTLLCTYLVPTRGQSLAASKALSLLYTVLIPCINPIIYSFRNKDIKEAIHRSILLDR